MMHRRYCGMPDPSSSQSADTLDLAPAGSDPSVVDAEPEAAVSLRKLLKVSLQPKQARELTYGQRRVDVEFRSRWLSPTETGWASKRPRDGFNLASASDQRLLA